MTDGRRALAALTRVAVSEGVGECGRRPRPALVISTGSDHGASSAAGQGVVPGLAHACGWCSSPARGGAHVECQLQEEVQVEAEAQEPQEVGCPRRGPAVVSMASGHQAGASGRESS